jgi:hypothetical protein
MLAGLVAVAGEASVIVEEEMQGLSVAPADRFLLDSKYDSHGESNKKLFGQEACGWYLL